MNYAVEETKNIERYVRMTLNVSTRPMVPCMSLSGLK